MSPSHPSGRWWVRPVLGLAIIIVAIAGVIPARHAAPSPRPAAPQSMSAAPSAPSSPMRSNVGGAKPWSYQTATPSIDTETPVRSVITTAATLLLIDKHDSSSNLRTRDRIGERLACLVMSGLRVWFTEIPAHQAQSIIPGERVAGINYRPTTAPMTIWEGTTTIRLTGSADPYDLSVHIRAAPSDGVWRLDAQDIDGDNAANQESTS